MWRALLIPLVLTLSCGDGRPPRAPFLCCVLTCNGSLVKAQKEAPMRGDAGFICNRGQPIEFDGSCSAEDGLECERDDDQSGGDGDGTPADAGQ